MPISLARLAACALASATVSTAILLPAPAAAQRIEPGTNGRNVRSVSYAQGSFAQLAGGEWAEYDLRGRQTFSFRERARDDWSVYLYDAARRTEIQIDIHRRMITVAQGGGPRRDLYPITQAGYRRDDNRRDDGWRGDDRRDDGWRGDDRRDDGRRPGAPWRGEAFRIDAGPIWNQADAQRKCSELADRAGGRWTGQWSTVIQGRMSVCEIRLRP
jgi:hypothetical protein